MARGKRRQIDGSNSRIAPLDLYRIESALSLRFELLSRTESKEKLFYGRRSWLHGPYDSDEMDAARYGQ
jgi:hypothetical protein